MACPGCPPRRPAVCLRDVAKALLGPGGRPPSPLETWGHRCPVRGTPSQASPSPCRAMRGAAAERPGDSALPSHRGWPRTPGARVPGGRGKGSLAGSHHRDHPHPRHQDLVGHEVGGLDKFVFLRDLSRCLKGGTGGVPSLHHSPVPVTCQQFLSLELGHSFNKGAGAPLAGLGGGPGWGLLTGRSPEEVAGPLTQLDPRPDGLRSSGQPVHRLWVGGGVLLGMCPIRPGRGRGQGRLVGGPLQSPGPEPT